MPLGPLRSPVCVGTPSLWPLLRPSVEFAELRLEEGCAAVVHAVCTPTSKRLAAVRAGERHLTQSSCGEAGSAAEGNRPITVARAFVPVCLKHTVGRGEGTRVETVCN